MSEPYVSPRARLLEAAGTLRGIAIDAAVWTAVCRWSSLRDDRSHASYAASEMLACTRRKLAGRHRNSPRFFELRWAACEQRALWSAAGCPGIVAAIEHTITYLQPFRTALLH